MNPIKFKQQTCVYAEHQPEYKPLPACVTADGEVVTCWQLSWKERFKLLWTGRLWLRVLTFHDRLQPQLPSVDTPFVKPEAKR